jgi:hypothetical protein
LELQLRIQQNLFVLLRYTHTHTHTFSRWVGYFLPKSILPGFMFLIKNIKSVWNLLQNIGKKSPKKKINK